MEKTPKIPNQEKTQFFPGLKRSVRVFLENEWVIFSIITLIVGSLFLIFIELSLPPQSPYFEQVHLLTDLVVYFLIAELSLRWFIARSNAEFFKEYWIDILAIIPMLRVFRLSRAFVILRLVRVFTMANYFRRHFFNIRHLFTKRFQDYFMIISFVCLSLMAGTIGYLSFEPEFENGLGKAFWTSLFTLFSGEYTSSYPQNFGARVTSLFLIFFNMTIFALVTGVVASIMIEKIQDQRVFMERKLAALENHMVICGWNSKGWVIIEELRKNFPKGEFDIVIISKFPQLVTEFSAGSSKFNNLIFLMDSFTSVNALKKARIHEASRAIILSENSPDQTLEDTDARTILAALTIEKLNPTIHSVAEIMDETHESHLRLAGVEHVAIRGKVSGNILAHAALKDGLLSVFEELSSTNAGNEFFIVPIPKKYLGVPFLETIIPVKNEADAIVVGVWTPEKGTILNPKNHLLLEGQKLVVIGEKIPNLDNGSS